MATMNRVLRTAADALVEESEDGIVMITMESDIDEIRIVSIDPNGWASIRDTGTVA